MDEIDFLGISDSLLSELLALVVWAPSLSKSGEAAVLPKPNFFVEEALDFSGFENLERIPFFWGSGVFLSDA